jgi:hypothetical protein
MEMPVRVPDGSDTSAGTKEGDLKHENVYNGQKCMKLAFAGIKERRIIDVNGWRNGG